MRANKHSLVFIGWLLWLLPAVGFGQATGLRSDYPVLKSGTILPNAWAGGFNNPQFSTIDVDGDGLEDLFVFERSDRSINLFKNLGGGAYSYEPTWAQYFPPLPLGGWVLLKDADGDGKKDLFTDTLSSIKVYRNIGLTGGAPAFELWENFLYTRFARSAGDTLDIPLSNLSSDVPGLVDVDADGDLDILCWNSSSGVLVQLHRNFGVEFYGRQDTLLYYQASDCWGHFREDYDVVNKQYTAELNYLLCEPFEFKVQHQGGCLLPINLNGDTLVDLLVSDADITYALGLVNGGTRRIANMVSVLPDFPAGDPISVFAYPAFFYEDVSGDGEKDLLAVNNEDGLPGERTRSVLLYKNNGLTDNPSFEKVTDAWLQEQMIETGAGASPAFFDENGDGLLDMVVANGAKYTTTSPTAQQTASLTLYRNVGTTTAPAFDWVTDDYLGLTAEPALTGSNRWSPAFADIDNDGDQDFFLGYLEFGQPNGLLYFRNASQAGQQAVFELVTTDFAALASQNLRGLAPTFADLDQDGDLDLVVGTYVGNILLAQNQGTPGVPAFEVITSQWGGVQVGEPDIGQPGYAKPALADVTGDNQPELIVGENLGTVRVFTGLSLDPLAPNFTELDPLIDFDFGLRAAPAVASITADDTLTVLVGTERGGVQYLRIAGRVYDTPDESKAKVTFGLYPNPAAGFVLLRAPRGASYKIYDLAGRQFGSGQVQFADTPEEVSLGGLGSGLYICVFEYQGLREAVRFIVSATAP